MDESPGPPVSSTSVWKWVDSLRDRIDYISIIEWVPGRFPLRVALIRCRQLSERIRETVKAACLDGIGLQSVLRAEISFFPSCCKAMYPTRVEKLRAKPIAHVARVFCVQRRGCGTMNP